MRVSGSGHRVKTFALTRPSWESGTLTLRVGAGQRQKTLTLTLTFEGRVGTGQAGPRPVEQVYLQPLNHQRPTPIWRSPNLRESICPLQGIRLNFKRHISWVSLPGGYRHIPTSSMSRVKFSENFRIFQDVSESFKTFWNMLECSRMF